MFINNTNGDPLYYEVLGEGEPLVLLPGSSESHVGLKESGVADLFAQHFKVVLMDFTGLGRSAHVEEIKSAQWCDDLISVLDALDIQKAHMGGTTLGSRVAARVAAESPERVATLLVDMPITMIDDSAAEALAKIFEPSPTNRNAERWQRWHGEDWLAVMTFFAATRADRDFQDYLSPRNYMDRIAAPTLICRGDRDNDIHPLAQATEWHKAAQNSRLWIEPGASSPSLLQACPEVVVTRYLRLIEDTKAKKD